MKEYLIGTFHKYTTTNDFCREENIVLYYYYLMILLYTVLLFSFWKCHNNIIIKDQSPLKGTRYLLLIYKMT